MPMKSKDINKKYGQKLIWCLEEGNEQCEHCLGFYYSTLVRKKLLSRKKAFELENREKKNCLKHFHILKKMIIKIMR